MTIENRPMNDKLTKLERCAEDAPEGTYVEAKALVEFMGDTMDSIIAGLQGLGMRGDNSDLCRDLHAALYGYVKASNPEAYFLAASEGFGEHMTGPARERVIAGAVRDRDTLRQLGVTTAVRD